MFIVSVNSFSTAQWSGDLRLNKLLWIPDGGCELCLQQWPGFKCRLWPSAQHLSLTHFSLTITVTESLSLSLTCWVISSEDDTVIKSVFDQKGSTY